MKNSVFSIVLAHSHPIVLEGLSVFLDGRVDFRVSNRIVSDAEWTISKDQKPDLLIVDYANPVFFSLDELGHLLQEIQDLNVLIISADDDKNSILSAYHHGIKGFVTQDCSREELLLAVQTTARGEKFFSSKILNVILERHNGDKKLNAIGHDEESGNLTIRETEILKFLAQGYSTQRIADVLFLSPHTVQTHRKSIIRKLKIKSPTQFVIHAMDLGILLPKK